MLDSEMAHPSPDIHSPESNLYFHACLAPWLVVLDCDWIGLDRVLLVDTLVNGLVRAAG